GRRHRDLNPRARGPHPDHHRQPQPHPPRALRRGLRRGLRGHAPARARQLARARADRLRPPDEHRRPHLERRLDARRSRLAVSELAPPARRVPHPRIPHRTHRIEVTIMTRRTLFSLGGFAAVLALLISFAVGNYIFRGSPTTPPADPAASAEEAQDPADSPHDADSDADSDAGDEAAPEEGA